MFYVFDTNGPVFHDARERLSRISAVRGSARSSSLRSSADGVDRKEPDHDEEKHSRQSQPRKGAMAASAYMAVQSPHQTQRRVLNTVADVMSTRLLSISARATLEQAWEVFTRRKIAQMPVVGNDGRVVGLLLRSEIAPASLSQLDSWLAHQRVQDVMLTPVPAVSADTSLRHLAHALLETGLPGLPVTDSSGKPTGFVSRTDILRALAADPPLDLWG